jgi:hypothetical protein
MSTEAKIEEARRAARRVGLHIKRDRCLPNGDVCFKLVRYSEETIGVGFTVDSLIETCRKIRDERDVL